MTASQIIEEIKRLSSKEKAEVLIAVLRSQTTKRQLSPDELVALADQMVATKDPEEADRLEKRFSRAFMAAERCPTFDVKAFPSRRWRISPGEFDNGKFQLRNWDCLRFRWLLIQKFQRAAGSDDFRK